jgi:hypothetical protein
VTTCSRVRASLNRVSWCAAIVAACGLLGGAASITLAAVSGPYAQPSDPCSVVDLEPLGPELGTPSSPQTQSEGQLMGCAYDLTATDAINTFKVFVSVDDDAANRYAASAANWNGSAWANGYVPEPITGIGTNALYAVRLADDERRLESVLLVLDRNLYLEARFSGGGSTPWDTAALRDRIIESARSTMAMLAKR